MRIAMNRLLLVALIGTSVLFGFVGMSCYKTVEKVRQVPIYDMEKTQVGTENQPVYEDVEKEPAVVVANGKLGIVPFSNGSSQPGMGAGLAEEVEYWFDENRNVINERMGKRCEGRPSCFQVFGKAQLSQVMSEAELAETGAITVATGAKLKSELGLDYVLTGRVRTYTAEECSVLVKVIDTGTGQTVWSQRVDGPNFETVVALMGEYFLPHTEKKQTGTQEIPVFDIKKVQKGVTQETYKVREKVKSRLASYLESGVRHWPTRYYDDPWSYEASLAFGINKNPGRVAVTAVGGLTLMYGMDAAMVRDDDDVYGEWTEDPDRVWGLGIFARIIPQIQWKFFYVAPELGLGINITFADDPNTTADECEEWHEGNSEDQMECKYVDGAGFVFIDLGVSFGFRIKFFSIGPYLRGSVTFPPVADFGGENFDHLATWQLGGRIAFTL
jgi:TolB-like protein